MNMNDCFVVTKHNATGRSLHFYPTYEAAYKNGQRFIEEDGAHRVDIKSPGGDCLRTFAAGMVQVK